MKKGLKIAAITVGVIIILMLLLPFAFQGKIADIVKTEGNKMLNAQFDFKKLNISLFRNFRQPLPRLPLQKKNLPLSK